MPVETFDALKPETRAVAERYIGDVDTVLRPHDREVADATVEDLRDHLCAVLDSASTPADVVRLTEQLGAPSGSAEGAESSRKTVDDTEPAGRLLGIPYDYRLTGSPRSPPHSPQASGRSRLRAFSHRRSGPLCRRSRSSRRCLFRSPYSSDSPEQVGLPSNAATYTPRLKADSVG